MTEHQDRMSDAARMERVMAALSESGHEGRVREEWGGTFPDLMRFLAIATAPAEDGLVALRESIVRGPMSTMVFVGEHGTVADVAREPVVESASRVLELLVPVSYSVRDGIRVSPADRAQRAPLRVVFGACLDMIIPDNSTGDGFRWLFQRQTNDRYYLFCTAEDLSLQVSERAMIWASFVYSLAVKRVVFVLPPAMIARVAAAVYGSLSVLYDVRRRNLAVAAREELVPLPHEFPETHFVPGGDWSDVGREFLQMEEAFGRVHHLVDRPTCTAGGHLSLYRQEQGLVIPPSAFTSLSPVPMLNILTGNERG